MKLIDMDISTLISQTRKASANPGGGAILILISNLALNLILMMDKKKWGDLEDRANVSHETIIDFSKQLERLMQDDVDGFDSLMSKFKSDCVSKSDYLDAASALRSMVDIDIKSLDILNFYLSNGKKSTLTDGEIANNLLKESVISSISTIKINMENTDEIIDYDQIKNKTYELYQANKKIIERRKK